MKQRDLLFAGLLLLAAPAFAQDGPTFDPTKDAKVVFTQDFESDWKTWSTTPVDSILKVQYWDHEGTSENNTMKPWSDGWKKIGKIRDTTMVLYNGVVVVDDLEVAKYGEKWAENDATSATIVKDGGAEQIDRNAAMAKYGEADRGGKYYFKFVTDTAPTKYNTNAYSTSSNLAARYRRNLFVRGLEIEDNSSYRLTFYAKAKVRTNAIPESYTKDVEPYLYADVMRGYFHNEKPFSMGYINDNANYQYTNSFQYDKSYFTGDWEKVTFMTYYTTDSIADYYVFVDGYWWATGQWTWQSKDSVGSTNPKDYDLNYIVQPDKYFVRLGFASNYTEFCIDNMTLTKSTIGGVEYYQDMLRVNFGYQTNLKDLAREAYAKTRIDAVAIPGDYFEVWGLKSDGTWEETPIASAEYQGDGFMYMFTDTYDDGGEEKHFTFEDYDKVLVTFINPTDKDKQLVYTGSTFPHANDVEWIKAGKVVDNFYNEEAQLNPYVFANVYSMNNRPPVMQKAEIEEGSFGLDGSIRELKFKFSSEMEIDNPSNAETRKKCIVYVNEEIWDRAWDNATKTLTLTRPSKYTSTLSGDYEVEIKNVFMPNTDRKGADVSVHYNFGAINRDLSTINFGSPVWDSKFYDETVNPANSKPLSPKGTAIAYNEWYGRFVVNNGTGENNASRLYRYTTEGLAIPRAVLVCPRNDANNPARLFLGHGEPIYIDLTAGNYVLRYKAQPINKTIGFKVYVYSWSATPQNIDAADKVLVSDHRSFDKNYNESLVKTADCNVDTILTTQFDDGFSVAATGRYIIEVAVDGASGNPYPSVLFSNFEICKSPVSFGPISALNNAVAVAQARAELAEAADKYAGAALTALKAQIAAYKVGGSFDSQNKKEPSAWTAATDATNAATEAMKLRMDTVDLLAAKANDVAKKLDDVAKENANWASLLDYKALQASKTTFDSYPFASKSNADITAFIKEMDDQIKALDQRIKDTKQFNAEMAKAKKLIDAEEEKSFPEYSALKDLYEDYADFDTLGGTDAALVAAMNAITDAAQAYNYGIGIVKIGTRRIKELDALATKLGSNIKENAVVKERFENLKSDDDYLAEIYKAAIKAAIYENAASITEEDLSPFIKNYYLYATPIYYENMDVSQPQNRSEFKYSEEKHGKANVGHTMHQWNKVPVWMVLTQTEFDDLLPGWAFTAGEGNGNDMTKVDSLNKTSNFESGAAVFDGALSFDWGSEAWLKQYVLNLPAGSYELGVDVRSSHKNSDKGTNGSGKLTVRPGGRGAVKPVSSSFTIGWINVKEFYVPNDSIAGKIDTLENTKDCDSTVFRSVKFDYAEDAEALKIEAEFKTGNGSGQVDNFKLTFKPQASYADSVIAAAKAEVEKVITVVDFTKAQKAANVEYYTLSGLKVDGIKPGQILIRKTTNANGKVAVDKVLLK